MNTKLENFKKEIRNKNVAVIGAGISNIPAIKFLAALGAKVTVLDKNINLLEENSILANIKINVSLGENYLSILEKEKFDFVLRSPGIKPFLKEVEVAVKNGAKLTSEMELFIELCQAKIIGVTGSDGKTTTTTLIAKFLEEAGEKVWIGGNIGTPLLEKIEEIEAKDIAVLELSSFQLMTMKKSADISVVTNISPNHLDYHRGYEEYIKAKTNIFTHQSKEGIVILNKDNGEFTSRFEKLAKGEIRYFSIADKVENGVYLNEGKICASFDGNVTNIANISDVKLVGIHNLANICCAAAAVFKITGAKPIEKVITTFAGVKHRMEMIREINGIRWYNDSIGTSPSRTIAGLVSFKDKIILIAGGYDKNIPYDVLGPYLVDKVKTLILLGKTADKIKKSAEDEMKKRKKKPDLKIYTFNSLEECVEFANEKAIEGDNVVMSPASASFDLYKNFEQRGDHFKRLVDGL
ncbi:MAG: UDP-N-acetylmuramoyl-L-alanine--D-glutamate ligase [Clostridia bacterium]